MVGAEGLYQFSDFPYYISKLYVYQLFPNQIKIFTKNQYKSVELNVLKTCMHHNFGCNFSQCQGLQQNRDHHCDSNLKPWQDANSHDTPI